MTAKIVVDRFRGRIIEISDIRNHPEAQITLRGFDPAEHHQPDDNAVTVSAFLAVADADRFAAELANASHRASLRNKQ